MILYDADGDDGKKENVDHHDDEDGKVEKEEYLVFSWADEARQVSYLSIEVWLRWKAVLQKEKNND